VAVTGAADTAVEGSFYPDTKRRGRIFGSDLFLFPCRRVISRVITEY
jgi:hypothetical protein